MYYRFIWKDGYIDYRKVVGLPPYYKRYYFERDDYREASFSFSWIEEPQEATMQSDAKITTFRRSSFCDGDWQYTEE